MKKVIEFTVLTDKIEEHFDTEEEARAFYDKLPKKNVQFFEKHWIYINGDYQEDFVRIIN